MRTDKQRKNASCPAGEARVRLAHVAGPYLEAAPSGSRRWFWKYYSDGKEKRLALGGYPDVGLKEARVARDEAIPSLRGRSSASVLASMQTRLAKDVFPWFGKRLLLQIGAPRIDLPRLIGKPLLLEPHRSDIRRRRVQSNPVESGCTKAASRSLRPWPGAWFRTPAGTDARGRPPSRRSVPAPGAPAPPRSVFTLTFPHGFAPRR